MTKRQKFFSALGRFFKDLFTKNIRLKVTALLFAILLWGYVLGIENPEYVKRVRDVEITYTGEDSLNARGLMLVSREQLLTDVDIECELSKHTDLDDNVTCTVDLSDRDITLDADEDSKTITRPVQAKVTSGYGTIQSLSVPSVDLEIARISSRSGIKVEIETQNALPDGFLFYLPETVTVSVRGQKSVIDQIAYGSVTIDLSTIKSFNSTRAVKTYDLVLPVQFKDISNNDLGEIVTSSGERVMANVSIVVRAYKDVPVVPTVSVSEDFDRYYEYECIPAIETIRIFGSPSKLSTVESIGTETIFPEGAGERRISVGLDIPDGITVDSNHNITTEQINGKEYLKISARLRVTEREADPAEFQIPIEYTQTRSGVVLDGTEPKTALIRVYATVKAMESFDPSMVLLNVDLQNYWAGTYELPIIWKGSVDLSMYEIELITENVTIVLIETALSDQPEE